MKSITEKINDILKLTEVDNSNFLFKDEKEAIKVAEFFKKNIKAPFVTAQVSTLGGPGNESILVKLSLDKKEDWANNIFHNSRYIGFHIEPNPAVSNIEQFMKGHTLKKNFRKQKGKTPKDIVKKINDYIKSVE